jgi:hypothetical protein
MASAECAETPIYTLTSFHNNPDLGGNFCVKNHHHAYQEVRHLEVKEFSTLNQDAGKLATISNGAAAMRRRWALVGQGVAE